MTSCSTAATTSRHWNSCERADTALSRSRATLSRRPSRNCVGSLPMVPAVSLNYGQAAILTPSDFPFSRDGILAEGVPDDFKYLAMAESERYLPDLVGTLEALMDKHGIGDQPITIRMTGCPNGCARPYLAEIGLVGKGPGLYNLHLGAAHNGSRLNQLYRESVKEAEIVQVLDSLFERYATERLESEYFGDFLVRRTILADPKGQETREGSA